jgi:uncharacterized protein (DUF58 family)
MIDPQALMRIRNLELRARSVVEGFWHGLHRSPYHGFSVEFTEYRSYSPGDDPRYLDWRLAARSDRYFIKKFEDETNLRCHLLVDQSRSMAYGPGGVTKAQYATTLAATFAYFLDQQGDAVGLFTFDETVREYLPARHRPGQLRQLMLSLEKPAAGRSTDLAAPLKRAAELLRKRGLVVLISDLLASPTELEAPLALLTAAGHEVLIFQILDPSEIDFKFDAAARFRDVESERELYIDPVLARADYLRKFAEHDTALTTLTQKIGAHRRTLTTSEPLDVALFDFLKTRSERGRMVRRRGQPVGSQ